MHSPSGDKFLDGIVSALARKGFRSVSTERVSREKPFNIFMIQSGTYDDGFSGTCRTFRRDRNTTFEEVKVSQEAAIHYPESVRYEVIRCRYLKVPLNLGFEIASGWWRYEGDLSKLSVSTKNVMADIGVR